MNTPKIFGIGFPRTGTSSLGQALETLGYSVCREATSLPPHVLRQSPRAIVEQLADIVDRYDAFEDLPWPLLYKQVDEAYPDAKFILTVRPTERWVHSMVNKYGARHGKMLEWIFGVGRVAGNETVYTERYDAHNREVRQYFAERPDDFLEFNMFEGDGWDKLAAFLAKPVPNTPFPHVNRQPERSQLPRDSVKKRLRRLAAQLFR